MVVVLDDLVVEQRRMSQLFPSQDRHLARDSTLQQGGTPRVRHQQEKDNVDSGEENVLKRIPEKIKGGKSKKIDRHWAKTNRAKTTWPTKASFSDPRNRAAHQPNYVPRALPLGTFSPYKSLVEAKSQAR